VVPISKTISGSKGDQFAIPAVNVVSSTSINAVLESASKVNSPVIVQFSNGGADFYAGKGLKSSKRAVIGAISGAKHIHTMAKEYGIPVVVHTATHQESFCHGLML